MDEMEKLNRVIYEKICFTNLKLMIFVTIMLFIGVLIGYFFCLTCRNI